jgi:hypothetical protein
MVWSLGCLTYAGICEEFGRVDESKSPYGMRARARARDEIFLAALEVEICDVVVL